MKAEPIHRLFITLRRSFAGSRETQVATLRSLGLSYRMQTVEQRNTACVRGAVHKVKHLVSVETEQERSARLAARRQARALREVIRVAH
ncbi:hypothetical protein WJX73_008870 [Symbiochloris irregularis]|uniref:Large ribosomal subunit protein uL30m n=1 Tax=Symbiochloris irregularis TaxID=706552 RepID=A0AAW1P162_9CHLO